MTQIQPTLDYAKGNLYYGLAWVLTEPRGEKQQHGEKGKSNEDLK